MTSVIRVKPLAKIFFCAVFFLHAFTPLFTKIKFINREEVCVLFRLLYAVKAARCNRRGAVNYKRGLSRKSSRRSPSTKTNFFSLFNIATLFVYIRILFEPVIRILNSHWFRVKIRFVFPHLPHNATKPARNCYMSFPRAF